MKLAQVFDPRSNALNAWRLLLAAEVIFIHSWGVTGRNPTNRPVYQLLLCVGVDGFFAISGFLITASWLSNPRVRDYFAARALRILPGFYACLIVTAFVFAPLGVAMQGGSATRLISSGAPLEFVLENSAVALVKFDIGGTPQGVPVAGVWNGSLWSLVWEVMCYLIVAVIGVVGLASHRWVSPAILVAALIGASLMPPLASPEELAHQQGNALVPLLFLACRTAIMFSAGALLYQWRDRIPARWSLVGVSLVIVALSSLLPDYRMVAALPLAYAIVVSGALIHNKRLRLRTDLSYGVYIYAFPIQQLLVIGGLKWLNPFVFFVVATAATLPLAAASWFFVENPARSLKRRLRRKSPALREQTKQTVLVVSTEVRGTALPPEFRGTA
ncbi:MULTISPECIES: acyltransferase [unclassified Mycobacterium]|uniref:acyltransferase family protein n=1 Tax=unclassified Mycobacterium TaxID=2642494 RepID=UPI0008018EAF|nr:MULTISPECIES: acyltransferase [unclassified Mycobacterium]OBG60232.1 acyltransferase [Mycobacterium sp. E188]OBH42837.1 acyltransferase [Mycobacterium sp. E183]